MIHYIILAHKSPETLYELVKSLDGTDSNIIIHLDLKENIKKYEHIDGINVQFTKHRVLVNRGGFGMVQGTLNCLDDISKTLKEDDHIVILSGQDFPIIHHQSIAKNLKTKYGKSLIEYRIQPNENWNILNRVIKYHFHDITINEGIEKLLYNIISLFIKIPPLRNQISIYILQRVANFFLPLKKFLVKNYKVYRGSSRMILSGKHGKYIIDFCKSKDGKKFNNSFKTIAGPDEIYFQTLLLNSPFNKDIINRLPRYIDRKKGPGLPRILDESDYEDIQKSDKRFMRKIESGVSSKLIKLTTI